MSEDQLSKDKSYVSSVIREFRICMPLSVEEHNIGKLCNTCEVSKNETGGGDGFKFLVNESREEVIAGEASGAVMRSQYEHKILYVESKVPAIIRKLAPSGSLAVNDKSWNAYPYIRTVYINDYMKDKFHIVIKTRHAKGIGEVENIHNLSAGQLAKRVVDKIDFVNNICDSQDYKTEEDPTLFQSQKTGRGELSVRLSNKITKMYPYDKREEITLLLLLR